MPLIVLKVNTDCKDKKTLIVQMYSSDNASGNLCICTVFSPYSHLNVQVAQCVECQASGPSIKEDRTYTPIIVKYPFFPPPKLIQLAPVYFLFILSGSVLVLCDIFFVLFIQEHFSHRLKPFIATNGIVRLGAEGSTPESSLDLT